MNIFSFPPSIPQLLVWALLAVITLVGVVAAFEAGVRARARHREFLQWEQERKRLAPPRPHPSKDRDALAGEYRERGRL